MYLLATQPGMLFVVSLISRYMENPTDFHLQGAKRMLRYLKGTIEFGIFYKREEMMNSLCTLIVIMLEIWRIERIL